MTSENRKKAIPRALAKAHRALASAELEAREGQAEAAINRAYYCVFHAARARLLAEGVQPRTHKGVNQRFNIDLVVTGKVEPEYLSILGKSQSEREAADYGLDDEPTLEQARQEISAARRFLDRMEQLLRAEGWL